MSKTLILPFNERKVTQAAALLLKLRGGRMHYLKLLKLLYLTDREALLRWGHPVTTDKYVSMDNGPVLSRTYNIVTDEPDPEGTSLWSQVISEPSEYQVELRKQNVTPDDDELSEAEVDLLNEIYAKYGRWNRWALVKETHKFREWKDPNGSSISISYRDILKAGGKTEHEIAFIEDELEGLAGC